MPQSDKLPEGDAVYLGIDLGTQGVRAVGMDAGGRVIGGGAHPLRSDVRDGPRHEQDPDEWWSAVGHATRTALSDLGGRPIAALAVDSTSGTILVEGANLRPQGRALMYDDTRAVTQAERAAAAGAAVWARFGVALQRSWALPRAMWLVENGAVPAGGRIVHQGDHVATRLTGTRTATDTSQALKTGVDLISLSWPSIVFEQIGLNPDLLPEPVLPGTPIGTVNQAAADHTGIPVGTLVKAGMTDGCAAQIACGAIHPGSWSTALGTTLVVKGASVQPLIDPTGAVYGHRSPDGGWLPGGASSTGAGIISRDFAGADLGALTTAAAAHEPAGGVRYPLAGVGERFPFVAPDALGFSEGVPDSDGAAFAAVLQGIAFLERLCYQRLAQLGAEIDGPIRISGGTSANGYWNQLRADILGREIVVPDSAEAAVGMAILAAAEPEGLARAANRMVRIDREYQPNPQRGARFDDAYAAFTQALTDRGWLAPQPQGVPG